MYDKNKKSLIKKRIFFIDLGEIYKFIYGKNFLIKELYVKPKEF